MKMCKFSYEMAKFKKQVGSQPPEEPDMTTQSNGSHYLHESMIAEGRSLCVTQSGRLCIAPSETRVGDGAAIFYGGKTAYIMRPNGEDFELLGDAYVHGVMKGESLKEPDFCSKVRWIRLV
jgi:hypothetical protein